MLDLISKIIATLNTIHVHGRDDLDSMLGCIQALEQLHDDLMKQETNNRDVK